MHIHRILCVFLKKPKKKKKQALLVLSEVGQRPVRDLSISTPPGAPVVCGVLKIKCCVSNSQPFSCRIRVLLPPPCLQRGRARMRLPGRQARVPRHCLRGALELLAQRAGCGHRRRRARGMPNTPQPLFFAPLPHKQPRNRNFNISDGGTYSSTSEVTFLDP